jgi:ubiquinol-cytochrome c reductase cytochrome b subunit
MASRSTASHARRTSPRGVTGRLAARIDRTRVGRWRRRMHAEAGMRTVAWHWSNLLGTAAVGCVIALFVTGIPLMIFYDPSSAPVRYDGPWQPLQGQQVSRAYASVMALSLELPGGLLLRQVHHWSALLLPALLILQLVVVYVTGRHRRPRRLAWLLLCGVLLTALLGGWSGYALPDDMLAGSGLRIFQGILLAVPLIGTPIASFLFGGSFPGTIIESIYPIHVGVVPVLLVALLVARATLAWQLPGQRRTERQDVPWVRDVPLPRVVPRVLGLLCITGAVVVLAGALVTVAPVWEAGPSDPGNATAGSQPDWYTGFLDGALRLVPPGWELQIAGATLTLALLVPLAVVGLFVAGVVAIPMLEDRVLRDRRHHLRVERPRDTPWRTALAASAVTFFCVLWGAGSADVIALVFHLALEHVLLAFQVAVFVAPVLAYVLARRLCADLRARDRDVLEHGVESGRIVRLAGGGYVEMHRELDAEERAVLASALDPDPQGAAAASPPEAVGAAAVIAARDLVRRAR